MDGQYKEMGQNTNNKQWLAKYYTENKLFQWATRTPQKDGGVNAGAPEGSNYCSTCDTHPIRNPVISHEEDFDRNITKLIS